MRGSPRRRAIVDYSEVDLEEVQASGILQEGRCKSANQGCCKNVHEIKLWE